jgi:hypothetical protein
MAFTNNALENSTSSFTITSLIPAFTSGVITIDNTGLLTEVDTGGAGTLFVGSSTIPKFLAVGSAGQILKSQGAGFDATWSNASGVSLGTTQYSVQVGGAAGVISSLASNGSTGQILTSGGASANPGWTTSTFPSTVATGDILSATGTNAVGVIAGTTATSGYVLTGNGSGVAATWQAPIGGLALAYVEVTAGGSVTMAPNTLYDVTYIYGSGNLNMSLPAGGNNGDVIYVIGYSWNIVNFWGVGADKNVYNTGTPNRKASVVFMKTVSGGWWCTSCSGVLNTSIIA